MISDSAPPPAGDLTAAFTPERQAPGRFVLRVPDTWQQGRGAFGGLVLAAMVRAIEQSEPDEERRVRSVNAEMGGPVVVGDATIEVTELRRGKGLSAWNATLSQGGQGLVRTSAVMARGRNSDAPRLYLPVPAGAASWGEVDALPMHLVPGAPTFTRHIEYRSTSALPFSGASEPLAEGWVRPRQPLASMGAAEIVALADAWWPAALATATVPRPSATVAFALQCFTPGATLDPSLPLFYRGRAIADHDGYMIEFRELWSTSGELVALNQQTFAWI